MSHCGSPSPIHHQPALHNTRAARHAAPCTQPRVESTRCPFMHAWCKMKHIMARIRNRTKSNSFFFHNTSGHSLAPPTMKNTHCHQAFNGQMETIGAVGLLLIGNSLPGHLPKARLMRTTSGRTNYRYVNHQELHCTHTHTGEKKEHSNKWLCNATLSLILQYFPTVSTFK